MATPKKVQIFSIKLNENEISEIVSMLMEFPAAKVYSTIRKMEIQTVEQRQIPEENKDYETIVDFSDQIKKESQ